ncbi:golgin subfamily A member 6-like protein 7 isoform X2 [Dreissena polymorpha]|uniref:golgin subfamily A member 6-like protein 7 isoform X2 n=1 Tax=Dreissena polymorpha TaxID=45954 RepID=UPI0022644E3F|nr:golgin subfamily A member 6-like protein 7 isoform X2 [Dreissena polymorpha]
MLPGTEFLKSMKPLLCQNNSAMDDRTHDGSKHQAIIRARSAEEKSNNCHKLADRKYSAPEIFVFEQVDEAEVASKNDYEQQSLLCHNLNSNCMPPGVSLLNFQSIVQELVKTKMFLHSQLKKIENEKAQELESLRSEVYTQKKHNQLLQVTTKSGMQIPSHHRTVSELEKCKIELSRRPNPSVQLKHEDSFELTLASQPAQVSHQVKEVADVQKLNDQISQLWKRNQELLGENESLKRCKEELESQYCNLRDKDEKSKNQRLEDQLLSMKENNKKLSEKVGELRQKYEELSLEKHALEKNLTLQDARASNVTLQKHSGESPHNSSQALSKGHTSKSVRTAELSSAETSRPLNIATKAVAFNNLNVDSEAKVSNVQVHECPRCLQNFNNEDFYFKHLQICIE